MYKQIQCKAVIGEKREKNIVGIGTVTLIIILTVPTIHGISTLFIEKKKFSCLNESYETRPRRPHYHQCRGLSIFQKKSTEFLQFITLRLDAKKSLKISKEKEKLKS